MVDVERLFFIPQYPAKMRYQEWWYWYLPQRFLEYFDEVYVISPNIDEVKKSSVDMFSPIDEAIDFEAMQVREYLRQKINDNDYVFFADISFSGIIAQIVYLKRKGKKFGFAHATSLNRFDYFAPVRRGKWLQEKGLIRVLDGVFVASEYHKNKIINLGGCSKEKEKIYVVGLPKPPFKTFREEKEYDVLFAGRQTRQKFRRVIWDEVRRMGYNGVIKLFGSWEEYYKGLSKAKVVLMMSREETYGYQVIEAIMNNSVVLAPRCCSFVELLDEKYLYGSVSEFREKLEYFVEHYWEVPEIKPKHKYLMENWVKNVYKIMSDCL